MARKPRTAEHLARSVELTRTRRRANPGKHAAWAREYRARNPRTAEQRAQKAIKDRKYRQANLEEIAAKKRAYREANQEKIAAKKRADYLANQDKVCVRTRAWREANPVKNAANIRDWLQSRPGYHNAATRKRDAKKLRATPAWANKDLIYSFYRMAKVFGLEVDHIVPLQSRIVCGLHVEHNLQLLTREENTRKGNKLIR